MRGIGSRKNDALIDSVCPVNWIAPLNRGLIAWYLAIPGWMGGSSWISLTGNSRLLALTGMDPQTDWLGPTNRPGGFGCLDFDGSNDYVANSQTYMNNGFRIIDRLSVAAWINPTDTGNSIYRTVVAKRVNGTATTNYQIYLSNAAGDDAGVLGYYNGSSEYKSTFAPAVSQWTHVAATVESTALTLFVNGASVHTATLSASPANASGTFKIGWSGTSNEYFWGRIDDVRVWNRCLSAAEVFQLYHNSRTGYQAELRRLPRMAAWEQAAAGSTQPRLIGGQLTESILAGGRLVA